MLKKYRIAIKATAASLMAAIILFVNADNIQRDQFFQGLKSKVKDIRKVQMKTLV